VLIKTLPRVESIGLHCAGMPRGEHQAGASGAGTMRRAPPLSTCLAAVLNARSRIADVQSVLQCAKRCCAPFVLLQTHGAMWYSNPGVICASHSRRAYAASETASGISQGRAGCGTLAVDKFLFSWGYISTAEMHCTMVVYNGVIRVIMSDSSTQPHALLVASDSALPRCHYGWGALRVSGEPRTQSNHAQSLSQPR
jgi:hypothetical protein